MTEVYICDAIRTPVGKFGGSLAAVRPDDLATLVLKEIKERNSGINWDEVDDVIMGCTNQAGEDNRNIARMALLMAGTHTPFRGQPLTGCVLRAWKLLVLLHGL